ncbi:MAG: tRNA (adenosine(37)-N6)-dimethylallyltransferase MiaA [Candidatus Altimarinota bacterium]
MSSLQLIADIQNHLENAAQSGQIPLITILGPTASGKTALGIALAKYFHGEIISADSRQIYRQMDIGTAKPTAAELQEVKHYLIDAFNPDQEFSLADFKKQAEFLIRKIYQHEKVPFLVGGTGLYISSVTQNYQLPEVPPNPELRQKLEDLAKQEGKQAVHDLLKEINPQAAQQIHFNNLRYVIRALEIAIHNQNSLNQAHAGNTVKPDFDLPIAPFFISIDWPRDQLYQMIERRIDQQIENGLIDETRRLLQQYSASLPAMSSLGYQEIAMFLAGHSTQEDAINLFKQNTRNYAKRQLTWFRRFKQVYLIPGAELQSIIAELKALKPQNDPINS